MSASDKVFGGSIPQIYDEYLVPLIFAGFADHLAQQVASLSPRSVLETAAGTGVVTRALAEKLSPDAHYVVTDLNQPMLDLAAQRQGDGREHPHTFWEHKYLLSYALVKLELTQRKD